MGKECHLPAIKGLTVISTGGKKNGKKHENVILHGVATKEYAPKTSCSIVGSKQNKHYFYISSAENRTMPFLQPIVTTNNDVVDVKATVNDGFQLDHFVVTKRVKPAQLALSFQCKKSEALW